MNSDQIIQFLEALKTDIIHSLQAAGSNTTGQTAKSLTVISNGNSFQLLLPGYMQLLETGRGPTSADPIMGDPPMVQRIQAWCRSKGIPDNAVWAVKKSIDKKGFKGKPGILTTPLSDDNISRQLDPVLEALADEIASLLLDLFD